MSTLAFKATLAAALLVVTFAPLATAQTAAPAPAAPATPATPATPLASAGTGPSLSVLDVMRTTLKSHPNIAAARAAVGASRAAVGIAEGPFDPRFQGGISHTHDVTPLLPFQRVVPDQRATITDTTDLTLGAALTTRIGTRLSPSVGFSRIHQRYQGVAAGTLPTDPFQQAHVGLSVSQPLLRGAGTVGAASAIDGARSAQGAAVHAVAQTAQEQVLVALGAYWRLVAAERQLELLRANQAAADKLLRDTSELVASDQRPRSDLRPLLGNLANRRRAVIEAENERLQAQHALAMAMGIGIEQARDWQPSQALPKVTLPSLSAADAVQRAKATRSDVQAAKAQLSAANADLRGAEYNTRAALDVNASVGYAGALDRDGVGPFFAASARNVRGVDAGVGLSLELPFNNTAQLADRDLKRARFDQARIAAADLDRSYPIAVSQALDDLRLSAQALAAATEAVEQYQSVIDDQREKLRAGAGTVIDMILTEDLLINAQQSQTINHLRYAEALTRLWFETGALPRSDADSSRAAATLLGGGP